MRGSDGGQRSVEDLRPADEVVEGGFLENAATHETEKNEPFFFNFLGPPDAEEG
jgi:hypothetical protein